MTKKKNYGISTGTSSLLVIIVILSLICFAGLSIVSANADYKLSCKLAERTTAYYEVSSKAQAQLLSLHNEFSLIYQESADKAAYLDKIKESYADSLTFTYPMNENQALVVSVTPLYPEDAPGPFWETDRYQITTLKEPELDNSLPVLLGN